MGIQASGASTVYLHITDLVTLIDHTTATLLVEFVDNFKRTGRGIATIVGLERMRARSHAETSMRVSPPVLAQERAAALDSLARISLSYVSPDQPDPIAVLKRISLTHVGLNAAQEDHPFVDALRYLVRKARATANFFRSMFVFDNVEAFTTADRDIEWMSLSRSKRDDTIPSDVEKLSLSSHEIPRLKNVGTPSDEHRAL